MLIGYARVNSDGQTLATQEAMLKEAGCQKVFSEKEKGSKTDRKELAKAIKALGPGDVLVFIRLERLARSTIDLLNVLNAVTAKGAGFRSLSEPMLDTTTPHGTLVVTILGAIAEFERKLIKARCDEGRVQARARGVKFGPKFKLTEHQKQEALKRLDAGETTREIGRLFNVSHQTIGRLA